MGIRILVGGPKLGRNPHTERPVSIGVQNLRGKFWESRLSFLFDLLCLTRGRRREDYRSSGAEQLCRGRNFRNRRKRSWTQSQLSSPAQPSSHLVSRKRYVSRQENRFLLLFVSWPFRFRHLQLFAVQAAAQTLAGARLLACSFKLWQQHGICTHTSASNPRQQNGALVKKNPLSYADSY